MTVKLIKGQTLGGVAYGKHAIVSGLPAAVEAALVQGGDAVLLPPPASLAPPTDWMMTRDSAQFGSSGVAAQIPVTTSRALTGADNGAVLFCDSPSTIYLTDPGTLGAGFACSTVQVGAGAVIMVGAVGAATITPPPSGSYTVKPDLAGSVFGAGIAAVNVQTILTAINATVWLPGIGELNFGFQNSSYSDPANTTLAVAAGPVRSLRAGRNTASVAVPALGSPMTTPPQLVPSGTTGAYCIDFGVTNVDAYNATPQPFGNRANPLMMMVVAAIASSSGRTIVSLRWGTNSSDRICINTTGAGANLVQARGNGFTMSGAVALGSTAKVITFRQSSDRLRNLREDGVQVAADTAIISGTAVTTSQLIGAESLGATGAVVASTEWRGPLYAVITANQSPSDADTLILERFFGSLAGIAIP